VDIRPRTLARGLPWLGSTLTIAALVSLRNEHFRHTGYVYTGITDALFMILYLLSAAFGVNVAWRSKRELMIRDHRNLFWCSLALAIAFPLLEYSNNAADRDWGTSSRLYFAMEHLTSIAAALLWSCALTRCDIPQSPLSRKFGIRLAIALLIGIAIQLWTSRIFGGYRSWWRDLLLYFRPQWMIHTTRHTLPAFFILSGCLEELWPRSKLDTHGSRDRVVHWAMMGWFLSHAGAWLYVVLWNVMQFQAPGHLFWAGLLSHDLYLLLGLTATLMLATQQTPSMGESTMAGSPNGSSL